MSAKEILVVICYNLMITLICQSQDKRVSLNHNGSVAYPPRFVRPKHLAFFFYNFGTRMSLRFLVVSALLLDSQKVKKQYHH